MALLAYIGRRLLFVGPQLAGILLVSFLLVKLIPGDPAVLMLGPFATQDALTKLRTELGLDQSLIEQFLLYLWHDRDAGVDLVIFNLPQPFDPTVLDPLADAVSALG